jgi:hypothetical protein
MPNYIQLISKTTNLPESFPVIDEKLCASLGVACDEKRYYQSWYDVIGYSTCNTIREVSEKVTKTLPKDTKLQVALQWLDENYTLNAWFSH